MTIAAVDLVNAALRRVGSRDISAIDDNTPGGAVANDVYTMERDEELREHTWNFAMARARLMKLRVSSAATLTPTFEYQYAYELPSDWLRTVSVHDNDAGSGQAIYKQETILSDNIITDPTFANWTLGSGWTASGNVATRTNQGVGSILSIAASFVTSGVYRVGFNLYGADPTSGTITPRFTTGSTVTGTSRLGDGYYAENMTAVASNAVFELSASASFYGSVEDVTVIRVDGTGKPAIVTSSEAIWLRYIRQVTNPDQMDPLFRKVLILRMAKVFALGVANSATYMQLFDAELKTAMRQAKSTDAIEDMPEVMPAGSWVTSRYGRDTSDWGNLNR